MWARNWCLMQVFEVRVQEMQLRVPNIKPELVGVLGCGDDAGCTELWCTGRMGRVWCWDGHRTLSRGKKGDRLQITDPSTALWVTPRLQQRHARFYPAPLPMYLEGVRVQADADCGSPPIILALYRRFPHVLLFQKKLEEHFVFLSSL